MSQSKIAEKLILISVSECESEDWDINFHRDAGKRLRNSLEKAKKITVFVECDGDIEIV
jgi:hypothetical protein